MNRRLLLAGIVLTMATVTFAQRVMSGNSAGTAGAAVSNIRGGEARWINPALLGLSGNPQMSIILPGGGYRLGNNAMKQSQMAEWFQKDRLWTEEERKTFTGGISGNFLMSASFGGGSGFQYGPWLGSIDMIGAMTAELPKGIIQMMVLGNQPGVSYPFSDTKGGVWSGLAITSSFAKTFHHPSYGDELAVGMTIRYIVGMSYTGIQKASGSIYTNISPDTVSAHGNFETASSTSGDGIGMDMGVAGRYNEKIGWSFALRNLTGTINWDKAKVNRNTFDVSDQGIPIDSLTQDRFLERWANYHSGEVTKNGTVSIKMAPSILLGGDYKYNSDWLFLSSIEQGFGITSTTIGGSSKIRFAMGAEYSKLAMQDAKFPLRTGLAFGGDSGFEVAFGGSAHYPTYHADLALTYERGMFSSAKGVGFTLTQSLLLK